MSAIPAEVNYFVRNTDWYERNLDIMKIAKECAVTNLMVHTGAPKKDCEEFVELKAAEAKPVIMHSTRRKENGDRIKIKIPFDEFLKEIIDDEAILSPNLVKYTNPKKKTSFLSAMIDSGLKDRKKIKGKMFVASMSGDDAGYMYNNNLQQAIKVFLNSISGAHGSPHNTLYNKTAHSALTSGCRVATSYSNSMAEWQLGGNRHYSSPDITYNNIISLATHANYSKWEMLVNDYGLHIPLASEVLESLQVSMKMYWDDTDGMKRISDLLGKLDGYQLCAVLYTSDLYHLRKYNESLVRELFSVIINRPSNKSITGEEADSIVKGADKDIVAVVGGFCGDFMAGKDVKAMRDESEDNYLTYAATIKHIDNTLEFYADLIDAIFVTTDVPPDMFNFPSSIRKVVMGSDTDSTMFTAQEWVKWYTGEFSMDFQADKIAAFSCYMLSMKVGHMLALTSRQMGIEDSKLYRLKMKNEFAFKVYGTANRAKHYVTMITNKEGNVYEEPEIEIKGVALKDSKMPKEIIKSVEREMTNAMLDVIDGKGINADPILQRMANLEHDMIASLKRGEITYLSNANVKSEFGYKNPMGSAYAHYDLWCNVWASKYGKCSPPQYRAVKVALDIEKAADCTIWIETLEPRMKEDYLRWCEKVGRVGSKNRWTMMLIPREMCERGIPSELVPIINIRKIVAELMQSYYIFLEIKGFYFRNKHNTRLISDELPYKEVPDETSTTS